MEWLQTVVTSVVGGSIAIGGAFLLERWRWRREDQVQYREQRSNLYTQLFRPFDDAARAIAVIRPPEHLTISAHPSTYDQIRAEAWNTLGGLHASLAELTPQFDVLAPQRIVSAFERVRVALDIVSVPARYMDHPDHHVTDEDMERLQKAMSTMRHQARYDLGHRD